MAASIWPADALTVVLLPKGDSGDTLLALAREWVQSGYLSHALWMRPDSFTSRPGMAADGRAMAIGVARNQELQEIEVDVFQELARNRFDTVRFVAVRLPSGSSDLGESVDAVAQSLQSSLPLMTADSTKRQTRLIRINLICSTTGGNEPASSVLYEPTWDLNVVAAAEDRSTPWSGDAFVRADQRFPGFVMLHVATAGGLWNGLPASPFDSIPEPRPGQVWVPRVFVSGVLTHGLARRIAARVLAKFADAGTRPMDMVTELPIPGTVQIDPGDRRSWTSWMVEQTLTFDGSRLTYVPISGFSEPARWRIFEWQQIRSFLVFTRDTLLVIPKWLWRGTRRAIGRSLTRWFQGAEGQAVVGIEQEDPLDLRDRILVDRHTELVNAHTSARKVMQDPARQVVNDRSTPELWTKIRRLVFGMLDGSELADIGVVRGENGVPVFRAVTDLLQHPDERWHPPQPLPEVVEGDITWSNAGLAAVYEQRLNERVDALRKEKDAVLQELVQLKDREQRILSTLQTVESGGA